MEGRGVWGKTRSMERGRCRVSAEAWGRTKAMEGVLIMLTPSLALGPLLTITLTIALAFAPALAARLGLDPALALVLTLTRSLPFTIAPTVPPSLRWLGVGPGPRQ